MRRLYASARTVAERVEATCFQRGLFSCRHFISRTVFVDICIALRHFVDNKKKKEEEEATAPERELPTKMQWGLFGAQKRWDGFHGPAEHTCRRIAQVEKEYDARVVNIKSCETPRLTTLGSVVCS